MNEKLRDQIAKERAAGLTAVRLLTAERDKLRALLAQSQGVKP